MSSSRLSMFSNYYWNMEILRQKSNLMWNVKDMSCISYCDETLYVYLCRIIHLGCGKSPDPVSIRKVNFWNQLPTIISFTSDKYINNACISVIKHHDQNKTLRGKGLVSSHVMKKSQCRNPSQEPENKSWHKVSGGVLFTDLLSMTSSARFLIHPWTSWQGMLPSSLAGQSSYIYL